MSGPQGGLPKGPPGPMMQPFHGTPSRPPGSGPPFSGPPMTTNQPNSSQMNNMSGPPSGPMMGGPTNSGPSMPPSSMSGPGRTQVRINLKHCLSLCQCSN